MAPLCHELKNCNDFFDVAICSTGQHKEMLDQVLDIFDIHPDYNFEIMKVGQSLSEITSRILLNMSELLDSFKPDIVLVHGDTTSALAASIASFYSQIKIGHVEAGLRTFDVDSPFPEEFNRQIISKVSHLHFAPTDLSKDNLLHENNPEKSIFVTGNTVIDSLLWVLQRLENDGIRKTKIQKLLSSQLSFNYLKSPFILITGHRRENFGRGFVNICKALATLSVRFPDMNFVYPVHLNPNVQKPVFDILEKHSNIYLIPPLEYEPFVYLLKHCYFVLTDSGGIQEEAPSLGKPVLVMRDVTERPEAVKAGTVKLVGANTQNIVLNVSNLIENKDTYKKMSMAHNPYGDGNAAKKISTELKELFHGKSK
jgi:UDP-N-acetylglucosamine 2-epimerase (non-hydrolysing)